MPTDFRERVYEHYARDPSQQRATPPSPYLERMLRRHFPAERSARVLDVGCGTGSLLLEAQRLGYTRLRGVDRSAEQVGLARSQGATMVEQGDLLPFLRSLPEGDVDVLTAFDVFEHLTRDELLEATALAHRVLAPGGRLVLHVPNATSPLVGRVRYGDLTHEQAFTSASLYQLLDPAGFGPLEFHEDTPVVHGVKSLARAALWKVLRTGLRLYLAAESGVSDEVFSQNVLVVAHRR